MRFLAVLALVSLAAARVEWGFDPSGAEHKDMVWGTPGWGQDPHYTTPEPNVP